MDDSTPASDDTPSDYGTGVFDIEAKSVLADLTALDTRERRLDAHLPHQAVDPVESRWPLEQNALCRRRVHYRRSLHDAHALIQLDSTSNLL